VNAPVTGLTLAAVVRRGRTALGKGRYGLGKGGRVPQNVIPLDENGYCDCSGFASWCLGVDRYQPKDIDGEWIETTAIVRDAFHDKKLFVAMNDRQPGYLLVYPDANGRQGHVGVISEVVNSKVTKVIHCSTGNERKSGRAIAETDPSVFLQHGAIAVKFRALAGEMK
jgi:hypothetical protein